MCAVCVTKATVGENITAEYYLHPDRKQCTPCTDLDNIWTTFSNSPTLIVFSVLLLFAVVAGVSILCSSSTKSMNDKMMTIRRIEETWEQCTTMRALLSSVSGGVKKSKVKIKCLASFGQITANIGTNDRGCMQHASI